jgi:hypothetical protein
MFAWLVALFTVDGRVAKERARARKWKRRAELLALERDGLLKINERNHRRVEAETKAYGVKIVDAEMNGAK